MLNNKLEKINSETENSFITKYGLVSNKIKEVIHIDMKGKVVPTIKKNSYNNEIKPVKEKIIKFINSTINNSELFLENKICDFELSEKSATYLRDTNVKYSFYLKPKTIKPIKDYNYELSILTTKINDFIINELNSIGFIPK